MPRDKDTGKTRGFGFVMYEDQRSTVLAVDNLNGGQVVDRTIRVDHVKNYKQPRVMNDEGELIERDEQSLNALPQLVRGECLQSTLAVLNRTHTRSGVCYQMAMCLMMVSAI